MSSYSDGILKPLAHSTVNGTLTHSESLLPMIDFCLKNADIAFSDIEMTAVSAGPGSFTGVRIGTATIKGLTFANPDILCVGVSTLEALAYNLSETSAENIILTVMDARRNQFYNAFFSFAENGKLERRTEDDLADFESIAKRIENEFSGKKIILTGDGAELFYRLCGRREEQNPNISLCGYGNMYQNAFSVARCAVSVCESAENKSCFTSEKMNPIYLRASQAERERNEKLSERGNK